MTVCEFCEDPATETNGRGEEVCDGCAFSRWLACDPYALDATEPNPLKET